MPALRCGEDEFDGVNPTAPGNFEPLSISEAPKAIHSPIDHIEDTTIIPKLVAQAKLVHKSQHQVLEVRTADE